jgi:hypothetical protein
MRTRVRAALLASAVLVVLLALVVPAYAAKDAFEPDNSFSAAKKIGISTDVLSTTLQAHTFDSKTDVDYVKFAAKKGTTYVVKVIGTDYTNEKRWMQLTIFRYSSSTKKWSEVDEWTASGDATIDYQVKATATTQYALRLKPYSKSGSGTSYGLRVVTNKYPAVVADAWESADNGLAHATSLVAQPVWNDTSHMSNDLYNYNTLYSACQLHSISTTSDGDWYSMTTQPGHEYHIVFDMGDRTDQTVNVDFTDSSGNPLTGWRRFSDTIEFGGFGWSAPTSATVYFRVTGNGKARFWYRIGFFSTP